MFVVHSGEQVAPPVPQCTLNTHSFWVGLAVSVLANTMPSATVTPIESSVLTKAFQTGWQDRPSGAPQDCGKASISPFCPPLE